MSRRGEYGYRDGSVQFPRRSSRERQAIYMSLDENFLLGNSAGDSLLRSLVDQANRSRDPVCPSFLVCLWCEISIISEDVKIVLGLNG